MYAAALAVMVSVVAMGAKICKFTATVVTVTAGDRGAMTVRFAPAGPVVVRLHCIGAMKFSDIKLPVVTEMVSEVLAITVSVSALFAVMVMVFARGALMNTLIESVTIVTV